MFSLSIKKVIAIVAVAGAGLTAGSAQAATVAESQKGYILLQVEQQGQAWYVYPKDLKRYYLGRPADAFAVMRRLGVGISNANLEKIPVSTSPADGDTKLRARFSGYILLQVEKNGEAWYVYPKNQRRYYLGRPTDAFTIMRSLGRGVTDVNLAEIPIGTIAGVTPPVNDGGVTLMERTVVTSRGSFSVKQLTVQLVVKGLKLMTDTGNTDDCGTNCTAHPLATYVSRRKGVAGIHGSYFCPPDYTTCRSQVNYYFYPVYNSFSKVMINAGRIKFLKEPMVAVDTSNHFFYYSRGDVFRSYKDFLETFVFESQETGGTGELQALISNGPGLVQSGKNVVDRYAMDTKQKTVKSFRGALGWKGDTVYLFVVRSATVPDAAAVATAMGLDFAINLDGGGSTALYHGGQYVVGPGRNLPNVIVLTR